MDNTRAQQKALDDEFSAPANRFKKGKGKFLRLSSNLKSKEPTLQVVLDALKLTPFYIAFEIIADVPEIYMQEFWVTVSRHHSSLRFKLNGKSYFMAKDQAIPRRNKMFWHYARNDFMFTIIRFITKHQDKQVYDAILPQHLTNQAMLKSEAYMTYRAYATGEKTLKPKSTKKKADSESSPKTKPTQASKGKRIKTSAKGDKPAKKKQSATKSKGVPDVPTYEFDDEKISWKSSDEEDDDEVRLNDDDDDDDDDNDDDEDNDDDDDDADNQDDDDQEDDGQDDEDQDDVNEQTDSDNDGGDFVHPKLSNKDQEVRHNDDERDEESDKEIQGTNVEEEEFNKEETNDEDKANELYRDVNVNLEGRDIEMTDAQQTNVQTTQVIEDTHVIITPVNPEGQQQSSSVSSGFVSNMLNPSPDTGIDSIFNLNTESTSLIDVLVTTIVEPPLLSTTTLPPPPTPLITHLQQTPVPTPATVPSSSLQDLPNFGSLFGFDHRLKTLENDFSEFKQTNQFAAAVSSIPGIVDAYLANKMHKAIKQLSRDEEDKDEELFAGSNRGSKRRRAGKELESTSAPKEKTSKTTRKSTEGWKAFVMNRLKVDTLTLELLAGPTFELMKGSCKSLVELEYFFEEVYKATTDKLDWNNPEDHFINNNLAYLSCGVSSRTYTTSVTKTKAANYRNIKWIKDLVLNTMESARRCPIQTEESLLSQLQYSEWHNFKHLAYSNPEVSFTRTKDKKNRFMRIDELHKFSDGLLNDVRTALDDHLKGIRMKYLPQTIWRQSDRDKVGATIQEIDKYVRLKTGGLCARAWQNSKFD
ncbi:hypothetical protein Tco_1068610 [Tanacetum coccineum]|uniref:Uncharacterized protein n=1 Tax=Tanacetum coccineum TaxID=301880 RepID=A0ABQ5HG60_9ASTR